MNTLQQLMSQGEINQTPYNCTLLYYLGESLEEELNSDYNDPKHWETPPNPEIQEQIHLMAGELWFATNERLSRALGIPKGYLLMHEGFSFLIQDSARAIISATGLSGVRP